MILGGGHLSEYSATCALGVNPGAASGTVIIDNTGGGGAFTLGVGDYIVYAFDSLAAFYGIITETSTGSADPTGGTAHTFSVADNRIRLQWQMVYGAWNMEDETWAKRLGRPTAPAAPGDSSSHGDDGVDFGSGLSIGSVEGISAPGDPGDTSAVRRRYWSILPRNWAARIRTWHDAPWTARQILNFAFDGAWGDFGFSRNYHSALSGLILTNLDHTQGVKLSSLISEINDKAGLEITITGSRTLVWHRKGSGLAPLPDSTCRDRNAGESLTANDTKIRVVGERIRVQVANVELEPDWKTGWEPFIGEVAWRREVAATFTEEFTGPDTKAKQAELSARAREITVWEYAKKKADASLFDGRPFGRASRNSIPAWTYLQEIVFRSYRVPPTKTLYGIPISSLEMGESLLCATDISGSGASAKQIYQTDPVEFYPSTQAEAIVRGQPLDLISARDIRLFYRNRTRDLRTEWSVLNDFEVDSANFSIRFAAPVFVDGLASAGESLFLKLNAGEGGETDVTSVVATPQSDYLDVIVPNHGCVLTAAPVKLSFTVLLGNYHRDYGSGPRRGALPVQGLGLHLLDVKGGIGGSLPGTASFANSNLTVPDPTSTGSSFREILYEDGGNAAAKAAAAAESITALSAVQASGGFKRCGSVGAAVSGVVDRVTVTVSHGGGVTEDVTYTKARSTGIALAERTLARIQRGSELFPGQEALRKEVRDYRAIAAASRGAEKGIETASRRRLADALGRAVGSETSSTQIIKDKNSAAPNRSGGTLWKAGDIVWVDGDGWPSAEGKGLAGVLVSTPVTVGGSQSRELTVTTRGIVPVRIRGTVTAGGTVLAEPGQHYGGSTGSKTIGTLMHGEDVPVPAGDAPEVLAMVNLGGGGGGGTAEVVPPLTIVTSKPAYIPAPPSPVAEGSRRFFLTWGMVNGVVASNWNNALDVSLTGGSKYLFMRANVNSPRSSSLRVTSCTWLTGNTADAHTTPDWPADGSRPSHIIIPLGQILVEDGVATPLSAGGGGIEINEHIAQIEEGSSASSVYRKRFSYRRLHY